MEKSSHKTYRKADIATFQENNIWARRFSNETAKSSNDTGKKPKKAKNIAKNQIFERDIEIGKIIFEMPVCIAMEFASWDTSYADVLTFAARRFGFFAPRYA